MVAQTSAICEYLPIPQQIKLWFSSKIQVIDWISTSLIVLPEVNDAKISETKQWQNLANLAGLVDYVMKKCEARSFWQIKESLAHNVFASAHLFHFDISHPHPVLSTLNAWVALDCVQKQTHKIP